MYYIINRETEKLELHFSKEEYQALPESDKGKIKSSFLFSKRGGCWVSRAKIPNLWRAEQVAKSLGAENQGKTGEALSFEEKMERKAERAEARADRMDARSDAAAGRAEQLQKPINDMHGDIAFFTQPNINTSSGRTFTRRREKMFAAFERGMDEFKKSEYYAERAETARRTADAAKKPSKDFCYRRVQDAEKNIRAQNKNMDSYRKYLSKLDAGETIKRYDGTEITRDEVLQWMENSAERIESEISRACYYQSCIDEQGGVQFSKENIKPGYVVKIKHYNDCTVLRTGPKNFTYRTPNGFDLTAAYAEIVEIVKEQESEKPTHPFKVGETFETSAYPAGHRVSQVWEIVRSTASTVTLKNQTTGETIRRTPKIRWTCEGDKWALCIGDHIDSMFYRAI